MKKITFTLCSNNYLGAAKVLIESLRLHHPEQELYIGLVDKRDSTIEYAELGATILSAEDVPMPDLHMLSEKFNIVELNTTVKPFYLKYFFDVLQADEVVYLDPDIRVYAPMREVMRGLQQAMITLTPHMLSPVDDQYGPNDYHILRTGIFNLGFVALAKHPQLSAFLDWWADRCLKYGFRRDEEGMFYDQIWMNYVPTFYDSHYIIRHPGYNAANWNLHERTFSTNAAGQWRVNQAYELAFFHFSHYDIFNPRALSKYNTRFTLENRPDVQPLFTEYHEEVVRHEGLRLRKLVPYYKGVFEAAEARRQAEFYTVRRKLVNKVTGLLNRFVA